MSVDKKRLQESKAMKGRVITRAKSSDNRETRRYQAKMQGRLTNRGILANEMVLDRYELDDLRHNKKLIKQIRKNVKDKVVHSKQALTQAKKVIENNEANQERLAQGKKLRKTDVLYTAFDRRQAENVLTKYAKYPHLPFVEDMIGGLRKVVS